MLNDTHRAGWYWLVGALVLGTPAVGSGQGTVADDRAALEALYNDTVAYALSGPADTNLVEGQSYELKVTADGPAPRDATFTIRRDRSASDAGDDDFTLAPASIVIRSGATEGTAMLTVTDDGVDERSEALVLLVSTAGGDDVGSLAFTLYDASVPVADDRAALEALYHATNGANWSRNDNWLTREPLAKSVFGRVFA